jgi:predicted DNA-binding protein
MTVVFHDDELYTDLKVAAVRRRRTASEIITEAVTEWLESREDAALAPLIKTARTEYKAKGGRPWVAVKQETNRSISKRNGKS